MPDIAEQIDAAIGAPPPAAADIDATLSLGRRALLRRRLAYGTGAAATVLVIAGTAWAVTPAEDGPGRSQGPGFAGGPSASAPAPSDAEPPKDGAGDSSMPWPGPDAARLEGPGRVEVEPGWTVTEDLSRAGRWWAVEIAKGDRLQWFLFGEAMTIGNAHAPAQGYDSFEEWVDVNAPLVEDAGPSGGGGSGGGDVTDWPGVPRDDLVHFVPRSVSSVRGLAPVGDVEIVDQRFNPDIGAAFAAPEDTGVAEVREDGTTWYVVARRPDDYIAVRGSVAKADYGIDGLDEFVAFARARYAEGGGGLL